jgi:uncharacterized surface protein with fasciclin (FAS1) repeats
MNPLPPAVAAIAALAVPTAASAAPSKDIVQTAQAAGQFRTLTKLVRAAGLQRTLSGQTRYTVFAPTDAAFAKVPKATLDALAKNRQQLRKVLLYHVVPGTVTARKVMKLRSARTAEGSRVRFRVRNGAVYVNNARVTAADVRASNGVIHVINRVLLPPG